MTHRQIILVLLLLFPAIARADIVFYRVPVIERVVVLEGTTVVNQGGSVTFKHPRGRLYFDLKDTRIEEVPTTAGLFQRRVRLAEGKADELMEAADWALRRGELDMYYEAVVKALEVDPQHPGANGVRDLKRRINEPLGDWSQQERELRELVGRPDMRIETSAHFILLHDTPDKPPAGQKLPRAQERLRLLEAVYESFLLRFYANGVDLEIPQERLKVVLFNDHRDFLDFAEALSPDLHNAAGFWDGSTNTAVFFDHGTSDVFKALQSLAEGLQRIKERGVKMRPSARPVYKLGNRIFPLKDLARMADTISLLIEIERENNDISVVSHEATHQLAANTGLLPRQVLVPTWAHEGLATYFEAPKEAAWSGIGAVNEERLDWYRQLERQLEQHRIRAAIEWTVTDRFFDSTTSLEDSTASLQIALHGYGQAWALTHFLMERHFDELMSYYRRLGEMPPHVMLNRHVLTEIFNEVFGEDRKRLELEWRSYMRSLKTDLEKILDEEGR